MSSVLTLNGGVLVSNGVAISHEGETYPDGDSMEWGSAGLTDLTGTSWYFNEILDCTNLISELVYDITFVSNNTSNNSLEYILFTNSCDELAFQSSGIIYVYPTPFPGIISEGWANEAYRTISITGGTDATNTDLIAWIQANATQITS